MEGSFWRGMLIGVSVLQASQDSLGKEKYIQLVELAWVDTSVWFWYFIIFGAIIWEVVARARIKQP